MILATVQRPNVHAAWQLEGRDHLQESEGAGRSKATQTTCTATGIIFRQMRVTSLKFMLHVTCYISPGFDDMYYLFSF